MVIKFRGMGEKQRQLPSDAVKDAVKEKLKRLRAGWRTANPRYKDDGTVEAIEEIENRLETAEANRLKQNRRNNRRIRVS